VGEFVSSFQKTWQGLTAAQRVGTVLALAAGGLLLAGVSYFANRPEYRPLAGGDASKVAEIAGALETAGITPRVNGTTVLVPADQFDRAYIAVASLGLNTDGVGFELLDKGTNAFTTSLLEKVNVQRATAGEIERILRGYPGIAKARVLISQDRETWRTTEKDGTASVSLTLRPGNQLGATDVAAIQACVANAWHSLRPENVAVMANGKKLTRETLDNDNKSFAAANHQLLTQSEFEETLRRRAQDALDRAQGPGKTNVTVVATLNFDHTLEKTRNGGDPDKRVPKRTETKETSRTNAEPSPVGAVGPSGDLASGAGDVNTAPRGENSETLNSTTTEYFETFVDTIHEKKGFEVTRLSVALFVDKSLGSRLAELEKVVKAAVGFDEKRKDQFSATSESEFAKPAEEVPAAEAVGSTNLPELISTGGRVAVLIALTILFLVLVKRAGRGSEARGTLTPMPGRGNPGAAGYAGAMNAVGAALPDGGEQRSPEELARNSALKNATAAAVSDPAAGGRVVRSWLEERRAR
jgi:flagellar M-ring protein FliF